MTTFQLKGDTLYHGSYSRVPLEIKGHWHLSGPQVVGRGGVPQSVADLFDANPKIDRIALASKDGANVVYSRIVEPKPRLFRHKDGYFPRPIAGVDKGRDPDGYLALSPDGTVTYKHVDPAAGADTNMTGVYTVEYMERQVERGSWVEFTEEDLTC